MLDTDTSRYEGIAPRHWLGIWRCGLTVSRSARVRLRGDRRAFVRAVAGDAWRSRRTTRRRTWPLSASRFRGFDIGNHFCEWCWDYSSTEPPYYSGSLKQWPTVDQQASLQGGMSAFSRAGARVTVYRGGCLRSPGPALGWQFRGGECLRSPGPVLGWKFTGGNVCVLPGRCSGESLQGGRSAFSRAGARVTVYRGGMSAFSRAGARVKVYRGGRSAFSRAGARVTVYRGGMSAFSRACARVKVYRGGRSAFSRAGARVKVYRGGMSAFSRAGARVKVYRGECLRSPGPVLGWKFTGGECLGESLIAEQIVS